MALSTNQQNDINTMCSRSKSYSIGSRLLNMTTAGAYADGTITIGGGTITGGTITTPTITNPTLSGGIETFEIDSIPITNQFPTSITTLTSTSIGQGAGGGFYRMPTTDITSCIVKLDTAPSAGDYITIFNPSSDTTGHLLLSSAGTIVGVFPTGASFTHLQMEIWDWVEMVALSATRWLVVHPYSTAAFTTYATTT